MPTWPLQVPCSGYLTLLWWSVNAADRTTSKTSGHHPHVLRVRTERGDTALLCTTKTFPWWECQILLLIRAGSLFVGHHISDASSLSRGSVQQGHHPGLLGSGSLVASLAELSQEKQPSSVPDFQAPTLTFIKDLQSWQDQNLSILSNLTTTLKHPQHKAWGKKNPTNNPQLKMIKLLMRWNWRNYRISPSPPPHSRLHLISATHFALGEH